MPKKTSGKLTQRQMSVLCELADRLADLFTEHDPSQPLGDCLLTFSRPGGNAKAGGFYRPEGWADSKGNTKAEIAINPEYMALLGLPEVIQTLVHEMCHQWQHEHGKPSRKGYHNKQFAWKMKAVGLMPSSTGKPGGKETGQRMSDYIIPDGPLDKFICKLPKRLKLPFMGLPSNRGKKKKKTGYLKYECPSCDLLARSVQDAHLVCGDCKKTMEVSE